MRRWPGLLAIMMLACQRPASRASVEPRSTREPILHGSYGAHPSHPHAIAIGAWLDTLSLPLADGGDFEFAQARGAGPVVFVWIGGAESESLTAWARGLDHSVAALDSRGVTLVFVRPLGLESSLDWASDLGLQSPVATDPLAAFAKLLDLVSEDQRPPSIDFAVLIVEDDGRVAYRKLGGRRPALDELLAVLDHDADDLRCCPAACVGPPCEL